MKRENRDNYRECLQIDSDSLDECLMEQPVLYERVATEHALAVSLRDEAELELEEASAELETSIRQKALKDEVKVTEGSIAAQLATMPKIHDLKMKHLRAKEAAELWKALENAYNQRLKAMEGVVTLKMRELAGISAKSGSTRIGNKLKDITVERVQTMRSAAMKERRRDE